MQELFEREAATLAELEHPKIPALYDHFEEEADDTRFAIENSASTRAQELGQHKFFYLVQQHMSGIDLSRALSQHGKFSESEVERCLKILLKILKDIHSGSLHSSRTLIVHRDIKPANIIARPRTISNQMAQGRRLPILTTGNFI
ncbi:MAG: hypothetical protein HC827_12160 [Cyanobacteria bacterium RM1_2_2]|nr:hypothetical protein [Cyanobacteria bacterium RM1_2_2]